MPERRGIRVERWWHQHWPGVANYVGTVLMAIAGVIGVFVAPAKEPDSPKATTGSESVAHAPFEWPLTAAATWTAVFLILGVVSVGVGYFAGRKRKESIGSLESRVERAERGLVEHAKAVEAMFKAALIGVMEELSIYNDEARASIYVKLDDSFVCLARVSRNPVLKVRGRPSYPSDQGVIGSGWQKRQTVLTDLPEARDEWEARMLEYGLSVEAARGLRMQCLSIVSIRIDAPTLEREAIGIVVYESLSKRGVNGTTIDNSKRAHAWQTLESALANMQPTLDAVAAESHRVSSEAASAI